MTGALASSFHDATKQTWRSVRSATHDLDWDRQPVPFKLYPDAAPIALPHDLSESDWPAVDALSGTPPPDRPRPDDRWLPWLLFYAAGITRPAAPDSSRTSFRAASSAGALYPVEVYVVCGDLSDDVPAGVYHFQPYDFSLVRLRSGDHRAVLARAAVDDEVARAPISLVLTGVPWRSTWKYGPRGYRHVWWDAGTVAANVLAAATARDLPARVLAGFVDRDLAALVGADLRHELPLAVLPVGVPGSSAAVPSAPLAPVDQRHLPLAPADEPEPAHRKVHQVAEFENAASVKVWRDRMRDLRAEVATTIHVPPALPLFDTIEQVILRRGATRRFGEDRLETVGLTWPLAVGSRDVPGDLADEGETALLHFAAVHAVEHVPPGAYRWRPEGLDLLRPGSFRGESATLCLEQELGGSGAATLFHCCPLNRALEVGGARAYRAVHLEAGIASGRVQLAAHTLGLGATPLTFYDDDVSRFFDTSALPLLATAIGPRPEPARPGRRPSG